jgi:GGDEF domain-containing protein
VPTNCLHRFGLFLASALELPILYYALNLRLMAGARPICEPARCRAPTRSPACRTAGLHRAPRLQPRACARQKQHCALLGVRISNFEAIAQEFGQEAAEKRWWLPASHLRRTSSTFDMAARVGEREFAVLLEAPVLPAGRDLAGAAACRQRTAADRVAPRPRLTLKFHVTAAMLPVPDLDGEGSLRWVLDGLDQMNHGERKLIRPLNF